MKLEKLASKVYNLENKLEEHFLRGGFKDLLSFSAKQVIQSKDFLSKGDSKTFTMKQIAALKKELMLHKEERDYEFLQKMFGKFPLFTILQTKDKLLILQHASFVNLSKGATLYSEGSEGKIFHN